MTRNWLLAHWRRMAMQAALVGILGITIALAALTVHQKRQALRLPLGQPIGVGRMHVAVPQSGWASPALSAETSGGDTVMMDELRPDGIPGRRVTVQRIPLGDLLVAPLEYLLRTPYLGQPSDVATASADNLRIQRQDVAGWPGIMVTRSTASLAGRRPQKQVIAASIVPPAQAVVIRLEEAGAAPDVADEELVRELAENVAISDSAGESIRPETGGVVELGGGVFAPVPDHFYKLPAAADRNRTSVDLLADGYWGSGWTAIELIPCLWFPGDDQRTFLSLLAIRDPQWHSGQVKHLADGMWKVDRIGSSGGVPGGFANAAAAEGVSFPTRAYCFANGAGANQAIIAIMHGGRRSDEDTLFDPAWKTISGGVRFTAHTDIAALLAGGREAIDKFIQAGPETYLSPDSGHQSWSRWDQTENIDKEMRWMDVAWARTAVPVDAAAAAGSDDSRKMWQGTRSWNARPMTYVVPDAPSETIEQSWEASADLTYYRQSTDRVRSASRQRTASQRWLLRDGKLHNHLAAAAASSRTDSAEDDQSAPPPPPPFIPGAWLPLVLGRLAGDKPMIVRTESFLGVDAAASAAAMADNALLTLCIKREYSDGMPCVAVTVNGTGRTTRWWYEPDGSVRYIDFPGGIRAQRD
jgi:hypothetical protein